MVVEHCKVERCEGTQYAAKLCKPHYSKEMHKMSMRVGKKRERGYYD